MNPESQKRYTAKAIIEVEYHFDTEPHLVEDMARCFAASMMNEIRKYCRASEGSVYLGWHEVKEITTKEEPPERFT